MDKVSYVIRLCFVVMFHVQRFEPHTSIIEGFGVLEMHFTVNIMNKMLCKRNN